MHSITPRAFPLRSKGLPAVFHTVALVHEPSSTEGLHERGTRARDFILQLALSNSEDWPASESPGAIRTTVNRRVW